jgi:hypothetical protein
VTVLSEIAQGVDLDVKSEDIKKKAGDIFARIEPLGGSPQGLYTLVFQSL